MNPRGFGIGNSLGKPFQRELHKKVLWGALSLVVGPAHPGEVIELDYDGEVKSKE
jgi:hypothetical protein